MEVTKNNLKFVRKLALASLFFVAAISIFGGLFLAQKANAAFNPQINYQGKLTDKNNTAVANGGYAMKFELFSASSGGSALWTENRTGANAVTTTNGLFSVLLGEVNTLPANYDFFAQDLYLEVSIGTTTPVVLTPRKHLGAVPAAFFANSAERFDGLATTSFLRTDLANSSATINNLTSTNFFSSYISSSGATSTNLFATVFNTLSAIISNLTATIANITTLVFGTATGNDLSVTNLNVTSTANIKTLNASSTAISGDLAVGGNATTTGYTAVATTTFKWSTASLVISEINSPVGNYPYFSVNSPSGVLGDKALFIEDRVMLIGQTKDPSFSLYSTGEEELKLTVNSSTDVVYFANANEYNFDNNLVTSGTVAATGGNSTNWNTAYGWGNHADAGYLTTALAGTTYFSLSDWYSTTTDGLDEGLTNKYYSDALVGTYLTGSTTLPSFLNYWTKTGNDLSYVAGNIGVGTTTPTVALVVDGAVNFQGINFATTTIGNYQSNIQFKETFYDLGVYGSYYSPMIYGNNTIPAAASVNTLFDNNISVVGRNDTDPTFKLLASNFEFINMKYSSSSNELSYTLQTLGGSSNDVLYKYNGRSEISTILEGSTIQQNASQLSVSVQQSGTAGFVASTINISTTTMGSGPAASIVQWVVGGNTKFDVNLEGDTRVNDLLMDIDNTGTANLGISADADLLTLTSGKLTVNGTVSSSALLVNGNSTTTGIFSTLSPLAGVGGINNGTFKIDWQYSGGMFGGYAPRMSFSSYALEAPLMFMNGTLGLVDVNNDSLNNKANLYFYNSSYSAVNGISSDAETDVMSFNDAVSYTFDNNVSITGNVTTTGYLTVGTAPVGANFSNGNLNIQNKLVVPYASTTALTVSGNSYLGTISSGIWNGAAVGLAYGGTATTTFSSGGVVFSDGSKLTQDTTNLFWNNTSKRLGVGTSSPSYNLHVYGSTTAGIAAIIENWADDDSILYFKNKNKRYQFQLDGDGSIGETNSFHFYDSTLSASRFTIGATTGYFGIGSTTPTSLLSVGANGLIADGSGNSTTSNSFYVGDTVKNLRTYMFPITSGGYTGSYLPVLKGLSYVTTTGVINSVNVGVGMEHGLQIIESDDGFPTNSTLINFTTRDLASNSGISWTSATDKMNFNSAATYDFDNQVSAGSGGVYGSNALTVNGTSRLAGYSEVVTGNTTNASFHIGEQDEEGGWFVSTIPSQIVMSGGADYVGSAWYARDTTASVLRLQSGNIIMNADSGLTVGNTFTPTYRFVVTPQGQMGLGLGNNISPSYDVQIATTTAGYATLFIQNQQGGATADVRLVMSNNSTLGSFTSASVIESDRTDVGGAGSTDMVFKNSLRTTLTERMRITAAGNVGIGTTSPTSRLFVTGASGTDVLTISSSTDDRIFYINNLGYVGIGTTTPGYDFQVMGKSLVVSKTGGALSSGSAGDNAGLLINTASDQTQIISYSSDVMNIATRWANDMVFKTNNSEKMRITSGGNIGIGTSTPANNLEVYNSAGTSTISIDAGTNRNSLLTLKYKSATKWNIYNNYSNSRLYVTSATGTGVYMISGGTSWTASSDIRLKENIKPIENALQKVMALNSYTYNFIGNSKTEAGLIAQEVYEQFPELVDTSGEYWGMNYDRVGAVLVNAIKEQQNEIINIKSSLANSSSTSLVVNSSPVGSDGSFTDLSVSSAATFYGTITVKGEAGFESKVVFKNDVDIEGKLYLDKDQTGTAIIPAGATTVQVVFEKPYRSVPKVVANLNLSTSSVFARFAVTQKTTSSFTIIIDAPAAEDLSFDWVAMGLRTEPAIGNVSESINEGSVAGAYESLENIGLDQLISDDNGILNLPVADLDNSDNMEETVPAESPATNEPEVPAATTEETSAPSEVPVATIETPAAETPAPVVESAPVEPAAETPAPVVE